MTLVDIFIPNYQYGQYLRAAVESALTQDIQGVRVLIIDNASTDDSVEVARRLASEDGRVECLEHPVNLGRVASINEGFDWAQSKYVMLLCADDYLTPGSLARAVAIMEQNAEIGFAYGKALDAVQGEATSLPESSSKPRWRISSGAQFIADRCNMPISYDAGFLLMRTAVQKKAGHFRTAAGYADDLEMLLRLACYGSVAATSAIQGVRREHGANVGSIYWNDKEVWLRAVDVALQSFFSNEGRFLADAAELHRLARRRLGATAYWSAVSQFIRGYPRASANLFKFAFGTSQQMMVLPPLGHLVQESALRRIKEIVSERLGAQGGGCRDGNSSSSK
jgi:glycosyltransferase involved in cell wall biosynthesis